MTETKFVFDAHGKLFREDVQRREIRITPHLAAAMSTDVPLRVLGVAQHEKWGQFNLCASANGECWWTAVLPKLNLYCPWRMVGGKWVPNLDNPEDLTQALLWTPPESMRLAFLVCVKWDMSYSVASKTSHSYLFAYDTGGSTWRLPLGNLYDECRICLGNENFKAATQMQCVAAVLDQFWGSQWNADLWSGREKTRALFAFAPKNEGFTQLPPERDWTHFCTKVGNSVSEKVTL